MVQVVKVPHLSKNQVEHAMELHRDLVVFDASTSIRAEWVKTNGVQHFRSTLDAGVTAINVTVFSPSSNFRNGAIQISEWCEALESVKDKAILATTVEDIRRAKRDHKVAVIFGPQNTVMIEDDLRLLRIFHRLGVKICQLTYNEGTLLGDGCTERTQKGLTNFGIDILEEMNRQGILVDLSHVSDAVVADALMQSKAPMAFTHVCCRDINGNPRNKTDEQIQALAENGGVIGVAAWSPLTHTKEDVQPTLDDYFTHLTRIVENVGIDHVGIGSDLPFGPSNTIDPKQWERERKKWPAVYGKWPLEKKRVIGFDDVSSFPNVTKGLVALGYSDTEVQKIMGENFLKLCENVWKK